MELCLPRDLVTEKMACIRISGPSMEPVIPNKSIVAIDGRQVDARRLIGSIVAAQNNVEGVIVKRLLEHEGALVLVSENPLFAPIAFDPRAWRIAGKAAWWIVKAPMKE
jgi:phage repressor protein C with HTH and peptisase S24 domain